ncbi:helix-turn-helix domain-containing protein [Saccharothrix violaceirubra]|uniref:PucR-like helix-turn-helix protein n=1 Tax=Saccharothrix violaceirubra TaxID=413306 RepID=A0A7W7T4E6_9PSEU|nr:helix-turn-helix domain-containing protein [Saccharothrix violaceirubra]MBB4966116.1 hypothetical protein [Saccharothrix violaceirubra]
MDDLYDRLRRRVATNARIVVDTCIAELPEYAATIVDHRDLAGMLDFAVFIRRRTVDLTAADEPMTPEDLATIASIGRVRGERGMPHAVLPRVLALHAAATFREVQEASGARDLTDTMQVLSWLSDQGSAGQRAYTLGFLNGQRRFLSPTGQVRRLAELTLAADPAAASYGEDIGVPLPDRIRVVVARCTPPHPVDEVIETVWQRHRVPATWTGPHELAVVLPAEPDTLAATVTEDLNATLGRPCLGTATATLSALPDAFSLARRVSTVAPGGFLYTIADLLLEVAVREMPEIERWLDGLAARLSSGPDLIATLDVYYRCDLNRAEAASTLHIHPRTLDYRLQRIRDLTSVDPHTTHGIRVLSTVVTRVRR